MPQIGYSDSMNFLESNELTQKGQQTRQRILDTAINLFTEQGYDQTTMRHIATAAGCSLGLAYRYFSQKEDLAIALYGQLAHESQQESLPLGTISERFHHVLMNKVQQMAPHDTTIAALFGAAMKPDNNVKIPGRDGYDDPMLEVFRNVIFDATDVPRQALADSMVNVLYSVYILVTLFWLYDRSVDKRATSFMIDFVRDAFKIVRPMLLMPAIANSLARLSELARVVFIGERPVKEQAAAAD